MQRRICAVFLLGALSATANANGAMGLGLEMWDLRYWFAYVLAMVVLEAWLIGRWLKCTWPVSIGVSVLANFVTGAVCGAGGLFAPFLHYSIVGSTANPNPFVNSVVLLLLFSIPSAWFESMIWRWITKPKNFGLTVWRVFLVHLATVPVGLAILLIPERPYRGMEGFTLHNRRMILMSLDDEIAAFIADKEQLPTSVDVRGIASELQPYLSDSGGDFALSFYEPNLGRFSTGENWALPYEVNAEIVGHRFEEPEGEVGEKWVWYIRRPFKPGQRHWGIVVELNWGQAKYAHEDEELGY